MSGVNSPVSILNHPNIWVFSLVLTILNLIALGVCIFTDNVHGTSLNAIFLLINVAGLIGNYLFRHTRIKMQEDEKAERRRELIRRTVGD